MVIVRAAAAEDRETIAAVLTCAFTGDPVVRWLLPEPSRDLRMFRVLTAWVHAAPDSAQIAYDGDIAVGAALWDPPGHRLTPRQRLMTYIGMAIAMGRALRRGIILDEIYTRHRPRGSFLYSRKSAQYPKAMAWARHFCSIVSIAPTDRPTWRAATHRTSRFTSGSDSR
jgi:hypothetical protein